MTNFSELRPTARAYVGAVVLCGAMIIARSVVTLYTDPIGTQWFVLAALTLLTGSFTVKIPSTNASLSVSETFVFASVLLFGAAAGAITVLLECLIILFWMKPQGKPFHRILFNLAAPAVAIWVSGTIFFFVSEIQPRSQTATPLETLFIPLLVFTALYFLLNSSLVAIALGFETGQSALQIWWTNFTWLSVNYFSGASVAALIVAYTRDLDVSTLIIIVPLLVVSYLTFRTAMGRVEDSNNHLTELNRLYLSTIETLAMAIDAKDQITHGHIRRVQTYAVGLATRVGVADNRLIKAIEAAALLHDMGKLAVPEYILNKPGKLTPAEFDKMKLHASVGADILSAIDFPYPVVPIVRHHHENWDGTGYPAGLKGTDIPIGARILSVVDCFDALTSDRPYRPRLSDDEALAILIERRATMYDPLIVDTFIKVYKELAPTPHPSALAVGPPKHALNEITSSIHASASSPTVKRDDTAASADEMLTLHELARALAGQASIADVGDVLSNHLRRLIPFSASVFFSYEVQSDQLEAKHVMGDVSPLLKGLRIAVGQRLSGWVAANRRTIINSDPVLDLADFANGRTSPLRSCLSTPLISNGQLVGVLTLYAPAIDAFNEDHRRIIEGVADQIAHTFRCAAEFDSARRDPVTGLPTLRQLKDLLAPVEGSSIAADVTLIFVDVSPLREVNSVHGRHAGDEVLRYVGRLTRSSLRVADLLFRHGSDEFVVFLRNTDTATANAIADRISRSLPPGKILLPNGITVAIEVTLACVSAPVDGESFIELAEAAHQRIVEQQKYTRSGLHVGVAS
jgi:diguanylate cyclase (GGDEF)-like protein/putative nucleotidyltransferase with HDIG domain